MDTKDCGRKLEKRHNLSIPLLKSVAARYGFSVSEMMALMTIHGEARRRKVSIISRRWVRHLLVDEFGYSHGEPPNFFQSMRMRGFLAFQNSYRRRIKLECHDCGDVVLLPALGMVLVEIHQLLTSGKKHPFVIDG